MKSPFGRSFVKNQKFEEFTYADPENRYPVIIGNDCWLGLGVSIIEGVSKGDGAVILANATVTKDVPPYAIYAGGRIIKYRFPEETIEKLCLIDFSKLTKEDIVQNIDELYSELDESFFQSSLYEKIIK